MKNKSSVFPFFIIFFLAGLSCNTIYQSQSLHYKDYRIDSSLPKDSAAIKLLQPYSEQVNSTMNSVIGIAPVSMEKKMPEGALGNFVVDAIMIMATEKYGRKIDAAFVNYGGIRLTQLPAGNVTTGKIFEIMPFDNLLVIQTVKGNVLEDFLDLIAKKGGWPVSGMTMQIKNKRAVNVMIGGKPLDPSLDYIILNSDFVTNGGDDADMLRNLPPIANTYLMRDAIFDYVAKLKSQGKNISATIENRIVNAD